MKIVTYKFNDGTTSEVEVSDELYAEIEQLDKDEYNNDHANTRRHFSLDRFLASHGDIQAPDNVEGEAMSHLFDNTELQDAFNKLLPRQQELIYKVYFDGYSLSDLAREEGVRPNTLVLRMRRIIERLQKILIPPETI